MNKVSRKDKRQKVKALVLRCSVLSDSEITWTVARQAPLSMGFCRQEYWSGLPFPPFSRKDRSKSKIIYAYKKKG